LAMAYAHARRRRMRHPEKTKLGTSCSIIEAMLVMVDSVAQGLLDLAWLAMGVTGAMGWMSVRAANRNWRLGAKRGALATFFLLTEAVLSFEYLLLSRSYRVIAVFEHSDQTLPMAFRLGALWGGDRGSLLLWCWILSSVLVIAAVRYRSADDRFRGLVLTLLAGTGVFFIGVNRIAADPFQLFNQTPTSGIGLDPLLQNIVMLIHPPIMYLGLVGMTLPACTVLAALWLAPPGLTWLVELRMQLMVVWGFLTAAIFLGGMWAYLVLGWGGYWEWDPVENAALLPWLAATLALHGLLRDVESRRLSLTTTISILGGYLLTLVATWITRGGALHDSVHTFVATGIGPYFSAYFWVVIAVSTGLIVWQKDRFATGRKPTAMWQQGLTISLSWIALSVLIGTLCPIWSTWIQGNSVVLSQGWFDWMTVPAFLWLTLSLGLSERAPGKNHWLSSWLGAVAGIVTALLIPSPYRFFSEIAYGVAGFSLAAITRQTWAWLRSVQRLSASRPGIRWSRLLSKRRKFGSTMIHLAFVIVVIAVSASHLDATRRSVHLNPNQSVVVAGRLLTNHGLIHRRGQGRVTTRARISVSQGRHSIWLRPGESVFLGSAEPIPLVAIHRGILADWYVVMTGYENRGAVWLEVSVNPLVSWLWAAMFAMVGGTLLVLSQSMRGFAGVSARIYPGAQKRRRMPNSVLGK
jgi:cytochrome c-type biogenesis protein CcmF